MFILKFNVQLLIGGVILAVIVWLSVALPFIVPVIGVVGENVGPDEILYPFKAVKDVAKS